MLVLLVGLLQLGLLGQFRPCMDDGQGVSRRKPFRDLGRLLYTRQHTIAVQDILLALATEQRCPTHGRHRALCLRAIQWSLADVTLSIVRYLFVLRWRRHIVSLSHLHHLVVRFLLLKIA